MTRLLEPVAKIIKERFGIDMVDTLQDSEQAEANDHTLQMEMVTVLNIC